MNDGSARTVPPPRAARRGDSADHFRLLADDAPVMIWVSGPDRKCVYFNRPWLEFTGRPLDEELGFGWTSGLHAEDRERFLATYADAFGSRSPFEVEYRLRRRDGQYRWILDKGVPLFSEGRLSGFVGSCVDITDRMLAEQAARRREEDFKRLAESIPDVIARLDRELRYLYVNRAVEDAFGRKPEAFIGRRHADIALAPEVAEPSARAMALAFESGAEQRFEFRAPSAGPSRHFATRVIPEKDAVGAVESVLVITYDVTARAREEEKRAALLERERSARASAETATLARDQFLAIVSHELRSPLNGIKSWTHVLENQLRDADPPVRRALEGIMIGVEHQVRLIDDLLDVTRAMSGNLGLAKQPMPLLPVLADAVEGLRAAAAEKGIAVTTDYVLGDVEIHGDPDRVRQIFVNLISNAIKFTGPGGTIHVACSANGAMARVEVRDTGAGIAREFIPYLFDPFRQADQGGSKRRQDGLGLGLALVQRLTELHGGSVSCESDGAERGAIFRVCLPLSGGSGARVLVPPVAAGAEDSASALPSLAGIRVLVIDDQREARESLATLLGQAGASVVTAASASHAIAVLEASAAEALPDVFVCDIAMPDEDGYATLKRIRAWEAADPRRAGPRRPAVALSAFTQRDDRIRALREGFQMHLTKPVAPAEIIIVISSVARGLRV